MPMALQQSELKVLFEGCAPCRGLSSSVGPFPVSLIAVIRAAQDCVAPLVAPQLLAVPWAA